MKAAVDIGTNSMRLLVVDDEGSEVERWARVTGLGKGVDASGRLSDDAIDRTIEVLADYGRIVRGYGVTGARAVATSASRDAANRAEFFDRAQEALGFRPEVIEGVDEAALSYRGATAGISAPGPYLVVDIGGGSTEFVLEDGGDIVGTSLDMGSVRLTDRFELERRPVEFDRLEAASRAVEATIESVRLPRRIETCIGVAGTWTSLSAIAQQLAEYDRTLVHESHIERNDLDRLVLKLAAMTVEETEQIPALDPKRAPVIVGGAIVAREVMRLLGVDTVVVSEHDLLDGVVAGL
jgi:exopolyphosphatase/guanosine-5'-triphosphate,3'-diphosphate pyrophosphatase